MDFRKWSREVLLLLPLFILVLMMSLRQAEGFRDEKPGRIQHVESGRILAESENKSESILTHRTERVDPLDGLKKYKGGFNITNKHYWSSTIFTGKFGYIIGAVCLVGGLIYAAILMICSACFTERKRFYRSRHSSFRQGYKWSLLFAVLLTILAIIASGAALGASTKFHSRAMTIKTIVVNTVNNASGTIFTVTEAVENLQNNSQLNQNVEGSSSLNSTSVKLNDEARRIERKTHRIMHWVSKGLNILNAVTIVTVSLNLAAILVLVVLGAIRLPRKVQMLIILCWLLIFLMWAYFGLYYFFGKFAGDVCIALDEYKQSPEISTLSSILPCNDRGSAATILYEVSGRVYDLIQQVNSNITSLRSSFSGLEYICNPFSGPPEYNYQPENCSSDTITIGQIPQVIEKYACSGSACDNGEFIPAHVYGELEVYTKSMQDMVNSYPVMKSLINCQLVKDAFSNILFNHCKPLKKYVHMSWASLAALSTVMVILILLWESEAYRKRKFLPSKGSVKPSFSAADSTEVDAADTDSNVMQRKPEPWLNAVSS